MDNILGNDQKQVFAKTVLLHYKDLHPEVLLTQEQVYAYLYEDPQQPVKANFNPSVDIAEIIMIAQAVCEIGSAVCPFIMGL